MRPEGSSPRRIPGGKFGFVSTDFVTSTRVRAGSINIRTSAATVSPLRPQVARIESRLRARQKRRSRLSHWLAQGLPRGLTGGMAGRVEMDRRLDVSSHPFGRRRNPARERGANTTVICQDRASHPVWRLAIPETWLASPHWAKGVTSRRSTRIRTLSTRTSSRDPEPLDESSNPLPPGLVRTLGMAGQGSRCHSQVLVVLRR